MYLYLPFFRCSIFFFANEIFSIVQPDVFYIFSSLLLLECFPRKKRWNAPEGNPPYHLKHKVSIDKSIWPSSQLGPFKTSLFHFKCSHWNLWDLKTFNWLHCACHLSKPTKGYFRRLPKYQLNINYLKFNSSAHKNSDQYRIASLNLTQWDLRIDIPLIKRFNGSALTWY